jgi:hypothetical protein
MTPLSPLQQQVVTEVEQQLGKKTWFKGVCMDHFPTDADIADNFDDAVSSVILETEMWDNHDLYSFSDDS